jgi:NADH-quinone oxidoreductase subunit L
MHFDPSLDWKLLLAVPAIPFFGYVIQIFLGRRLPRRGDFLLTGGMFVVMCITLYMAAKAIAAGFNGEEFSHQSMDTGFGFSWLYQTGKAFDSPLNLTAGLMYDGLGAAMLAVVGVVSFCVHLFSIGYMSEDRRYYIFFANISLFTFAMLGLVLSDNILFLFIFWELMGLMSYLLIGHFSHDPSSPRILQASSACKKAFLTTRVGDTCLFVGMMMFYLHFHTFRFPELWKLAHEAVAENGGAFPTWMTVAGLFVFGGTVGKSAQFPLHIWLPDAMEGPTPVSAMIHAATMVAAGVFLLGRTFPLLSPEVLSVVTVVGSFTALFAATIGTTVFDIKGVLAYSTISQLGFMVAAVGLGGVVPGMFHMTTHAFFKACLFLCAGSVIHGCHHEQDMRNMGGLRKFMPITFACMLVSTLAIAGIPLFSGFYSKDKIIMQAFQEGMSSFNGAAIFAAIALPLAALLTAFYMFRLIFMTFFGEYRGAHAHHAAHGDHDHAPHGALAKAAARAGHGEDEVFGHLPLGHDAPKHDEHGHAHEHAHGAPARAAVAHHAHADDHAHHAGDVHGHHTAPAHVPHESPWPMTVALCTLATLGIFGGHLWLNGDLLGNHTWFETLMTPERMFGKEIAEALVREPSHEIEHKAHILAMTVSLTVAFLGIALAYLIYIRKLIDPANIARSLGELYDLVANKYYIDEIVNASVIRSVMVLASFQKWIDENCVDGIVNGVGKINRSLGFVAAWIDLHIVDGAVNGVASLTQNLGSIARLFQTGRIQQYVSFAVAGGLVAAAWLILS